MDLTTKTQETATNGQNRKRKLGNKRNFFGWFLDNNDPSADDIAEVCKIAESVLSWFTNDGCLIVAAKLFLRPHFLKV